MKYIKPDLNVQELNLDDVLFVSTTMEVHNILSVDEEL